MVERLFRIIYQEISGLHEAAFILAGFVLLSQILAIVRDRLLAHIFGAGATLDIYYAAFRIPDFIYVSLASLVASAVLIPFIAPKLQDVERARQFFNSVFTLFFGAILAVSVVIFFAMPALSKFVVPGLSSSAQEELITLSRILLLSPLLLGLSGLFASITQSLRRFFVYAVSPTLYNAGIIIGIIFFYPYFGLSGIAYGVVLGALFHALVQMPVLVKNRFIPQFTTRFNWKEIKEVLLISLPRTITLSAHQITLLVLVALASLMEEGSISIFNLSFNLQSVPLSIIGVSYSVAAFPTLARLFSNGEREAFANQIATAIRHIIFWSLPVLSLFIVLRAQIVRTILGTGLFDWSATRLTAASLALFVVSVVAQGLMLLFVRGYYAAGKTLKPLLINVSSSLFIVFFSFFLLRLYSISDFFRYFIEALFRVEDIPGTQILMLPLAFSLGVLINVTALWFVFRKDFSVSSSGVGRTIQESLFGAVVSGFVAYQFLRFFDGVFDLNTFLGISAQGALSGVFGIIAGAAALRLLQNRELEEIAESFKHKFSKEKPIAPDQTSV